MINYDYEGVKNLMLAIINDAIQTFRRNKRAIKRYDEKIYLSVDLEETIDLLEHKNRLIGENNAITKFILNKNNIVYSNTDLNADNFIRLFREESSDDERTSPRNS